MSPVGGHPDTHRDDRVRTLATWICIADLSRLHITWRCSANGVVMTQARSGTSRQSGRRRGTRSKAAVAAATIVLLIVLIGWPMFTTWRVYRDEPQWQRAETVRHALAKWCAEQQPDGHNGWPEVAEILDEFEKAYRERLALVRQESDAAALDLQAYDDASHEAILDLNLVSRLESALAAPAFIYEFEEDASILNLLLPSITSAEGVTYALQQTAFRLAEAGEWDESLRHLQVSIDLGEAMSRLPFVVFASAGTGYQRRALATARHTLMHLSVPDEVAQRIGAMAADIPDPHFAYRIEASRLADEWKVRETHGTRGYMLPLPTLFDVDSLAGGVTSMSEVDPENDARSLMIAVRARWGLATSERINILIQDWHESAAHRTTQPFASRWDGWPPTELVSRINAPSMHMGRYIIGSIDRWVDRVDAVRTDRAATLLAVALRHHENEHGQLPTALDDLHPDVLAELPVDPAHDGRFGYRLVDGDADLFAKPDRTYRVAAPTPEGPPAAPARYIIYTYGPDGQDDGGFGFEEWSQRSAYRLSAGTDQILNPPTRWPF